MILFFFEVLIYLSFQSVTICAKGLEIGEVVILSVSIYVIHI